MMKLCWCAVVFCGFITAAFAQKNLQLLGKLSYGSVSLSNLDGYVDSAGREYALVGTENGLSIVDISNPATPVQVQFVAGNNSFWREVRHYKHYAYVVTEGGGGLQIVNLKFLPDSVRVKSIQPLGLTRSHTIFIDDNGIAYVNGANVGNGGTIFLNLEPDPWNPNVLGNFNNNYVHDCFVRGDTMWSALINDGMMKVVDVKQKAQTNQQQKTLATWATPGNFSHNCWLDDSGKFLFTTDERENSFLACYDVSNLNNVRETDRIQHKPGSNAIIHNTYWKDDFCITSYYTEGITIHDVSRKNNLIETGNFDTSPNWSGNQGGGFHGAWGVWPFLPSGNIIVSDIETGLYILKPTYQRACYLEGTVKDSVCGVMLNNVLVEILSTSANDNTRLNGSYATGIADSGAYAIRFTKTGYATKTLQNVVLKNGVLTTLHVELKPTSTVQVEIEVRDSATGLLLPNVKLRFQPKGSNQFVFYETDATGIFTACDIAQGTYAVHSGKWGFVTRVDTLQLAPNSNKHILILQRGYYDDFTFDYLWTVNSTAVAGKWVRAKPLGTTFQGQLSNPNTDVLTDLNQECFVTGNSGTQAGDDDVDDGFTELISPVFDLSISTDPHLVYHRWFFNGGGNGTPNDSFVVKLSNGLESKIIELVLSNDNQQSKWKFVKHRIKDYLQPTANMRVSFYTSDYAATGHLVEAGLDAFSIVDTAKILGIKSVESLAFDLQTKEVNGRKSLKVVEESFGVFELQLADFSGRILLSRNISSGEWFEVPETIQFPIVATATRDGEKRSVKLR